MKKRIFKNITVTIVMVSLIVGASLGSAGLVLNMLSTNAAKEMYAYATGEAATTDTATQIDDATKEKDVKRSERAENVTSMPLIVGQSAVIIDAKTGTVLYDKNMHVQREPASTTKIMTGILALENLKMDDVITIDEETAKTGGSSIALDIDEQISVKELLYAMFLESANDSAAALAKAVGGTIKDFAIMMNDKAIEIGAENTNFLNPHGLHEDGHMTTAYDLAMMAKYAMQNETFRKYVTTHKHVIPPTNKKEERPIVTTNILLHDELTMVNVNGTRRAAKYEGITGIKTGSTPEAGGCLVASAERNGTELIVVSLTSTYEDRFGDCIALLDWGFENYHTVKTVSKGDVIGNIDVKKGAVASVNLAAETDGYGTLGLDRGAEDLVKVLKVEQELQAPIKKGTHLGTVDYFYGDILVSSVNVVAAEDVKEGGMLSVFGITDKTAMKIYLVLGGIVAFFVASFVGIIVIRRKNKKKAKKRRAELAMKIAMEREMQRVYDNKKKYMR